MAKLSRVKTEVIKLRLNEDYRSIKLDNNNDRDGKER